MITRAILFERFLGREEELRHLIDVHDRSTRELRGATVSISGGAGVGKSRLLTEVSTALGPRRSAFVRVRCDETAVAYAPLLRVLEQLAGRRELREHPGFAEALELLTVPDADTRIEPSERKQHRIQSLVGALAFAAKRLGRLTIAIDDLHFSDRSSLELLRPVAAAARGVPLILLLTYRPDDLAGHGRAAAVTAIEREGADRIVLGPLSYKELANLVTALLPAASPAFLRRLYDLSDGVPYVAEELARSAVERGDLVPLEPSMTLRGAVLERVSRLPQRAQAIIERASVLGRNFASEDLLSLGPSRDEALAAFRAAVDLQIIEERSADADSWFRFRHALTREILYDQLMPLERREIHRAVANRIGDVHTRVPELAYHLEAAGEIERAVATNEKAGDDAAAIAAFGDAADLYGRALELTSDAANVAKLAPKLAEALRDSERIDELLATNARDAERLESAGLHEAALALRMIAIDAAGQARERDAFIILERAGASMTADTSPDLRFEWELRNAGRHRRQFRIDEALLACARAEAAIANPTVKQRNKLALARAIVYIHAEDDRNAFLALESRRPEVETQAGLVFEAESTEVLARIAYHRGDVGGAYRHWLDLADLWGRAHRPRQAGLGRTIAAYYAAEVGDFAYVEKASAEWQARHDDMPDTLLVAKSRLTRARGGDAAPPLQSLERAIERHRPFVIEKIARDLPWVLAGDASTARRIIKRALDAIVGPAIGGDFVATIVQFGNDDDVERALDAYVEPVANRIPGQIDHAMVCARLALRRHRPMEAREHARRCAELARPAGLWLELAHALAIAGDASAARRELLRVGATAELQRLELRGGAARPAPVATQKLTAREEQIYRLIASGFSSREAATRLGIATRTVETHLAKLYEKLGLNSRAELTAHFEQSANLN